MTRKGIIDPFSVKAGNIIGCLEGKLYETIEQNINKFDFTLLSISDWIEKERPSFLYQKELEDQFEEDLTNPDDSETTELGKVPHEELPSQNYNRVGTPLLPTFQKY